MRNIIGGPTWRASSTLACFALVATSLAGCAAGSDGMFGTSLSETRQGCPVSWNDPTCVSDGGDAGVRDGGGPGSDAGRGTDGGQPQPDSGVVCQDERDDSCTGNCNSSNGADTAACLAEGNRSGCTDEMFQGWCRRRTTEETLWPASVRNWVAMRCTGEITTEVDSGGYEWFVCHDTTTCTRYRCSTPLVLQFDTARGVVCRSDDGRSEFDLAAPGESPATRTDWPTVATPWLVLDRDGDGRITSGRELFGSAVMVGDRAARNGFEALERLDENHDGAVDARDSMFAALRAWSDRNGDRVSTPDELQPLSAYGIKSLPVAFSEQTRCDARGNCERERAPLVWTDAHGGAHTGALVDLHLSVR